MLTQESEYDRRMIVMNPDRALPFGCRNYHVLKSGHIQLTSYCWNNLLRVASLGREASVWNFEFWSNRSFVSSTAHSLNFLENWISNPVAGFWAALSINDFDDWLQCISSSTKLSSGFKIIIFEIIVLELLGRLSLRTIQSCQFVLSYFYYLPVVVYRESLRHYFKIQEMAQKSAPAAKSETVVSKVYLQLWLYLNGKTQ